MPEQELKSLKIKSVQGWALTDEDWYVQGLSVKLSNDLADYGDFVGAEQIQTKLVGGENAEIEAVTEAMTEVPADKKIAKVRVFEKDRLIPGQYVIHGIEFIGEDGAILA